MARSSARAQNSSSRKVSSYKPLIETLEDRYVLDAWGLSLDFGTPTSPVDKGFQQFGTSGYSSGDANGYGWTNPRRVEAYDTLLGSDLTRDGVRGTINTFAAQVPNGKYSVSALLGNERSFNDRITIFSNQGIIVNNLTNYRQRMVPVNYTTEVKDGIFKMTLVDAGGQYRYFSIASLQITSVPTNPGTPALSVSAGANQSGLEGASFLLGGQVSGGEGPFQYHWNFGDGTQTTGSLTPSKVFTDNGQYQVTLSVTDASNTTKTSSLTVSVNNVAPTATFTGAGAITLGDPASVAFSGQTDPSSSDVAAGFRYSYDFNNDGVFDVNNSTSGSAVVPASYFTSAGSYQVKGRIADKDGGYTDYSTTVVVSAPSDTTPPTATLINPVANATLTGSVSFSASASDNVGVTGVQYFLNNQAISPVLTSTGYQFNWNSASVSNGTYTVKAVAQDAAGNTGISVATSVTISNAYGNPLDKPVLNSTNFSYLGSFNLPYSANGWSTAFSTSGLTHRYVNGHLQFFTTSHAYSGGLVYEFDYPGIGIGGTLPQAKVIKNWGDIYTGKKWFGYESGSSNLTGNVQTNGLYYDRDLNRLYWSYGDLYNADFPFSPSIGYSTLDDTIGNATGVGAWSLTNRPEKFNRGGILKIPQWFADDYTNGRVLGVGFGGYYSIISSGSFGPALSAIDHPDILINPNRSDLPNTPLLGYPYTSNARAERNSNYTSYYDYGAWNPSNGVGYWTWSDVISGGGAWIDTASYGGVLILARMGQGNVYYQNSTTNADSYAFEWIVYDPKDLADVASGVKQQWQIQPKYRWQDSTLFTAGNVGSNMVGGMTYDEATGRLYVLVTGANYVGVEPYPRMYVYQIGTASPTEINAPLANAGEVKESNDDKETSKSASKQLTRKFQFGQKNAPNIEGYDKVTKGNKFSNETGYGWITGELWNVKQGTGATFATQGLGTSEGTYGVSIPKGKYLVTIRVGHPSMPLDQMGIFFQDTQVAVINTKPGQSMARSFHVKVTDGLLRMRMSDLGGRNRNVVIQSLEIVPV